jgi:hypothetical protein
MLLSIVMNGRHKQKEEKQERGARKDQKWQNCATEINSCLPLYQAKFIHKKLSEENTK